MSCFELFEAVLTDKDKVAEPVAFENQLEDLGNEVIQFSTFGQILKFIAVGTGIYAPVHGAFSDLAALVYAVFTVAAFAFLLFEGATFVTHKSAVCQYQFFRHINNLSILSAYIFSKKAFLANQIISFFFKNAMKTGFGAGCFRGGRLEANDNFVLFCTTNSDKVVDFGGIMLYKSNP